MVGRTANTYAWQYGFFWWLTKLLTDSIILQTSQWKHALCHIYKSYRKSFSKIPFLFFFFFQTQDSCVSQSQRKKKTSFRDKMVIKHTHTRLWCVDKRIQFFWDNTGDVARNGYNWRKVGNTPYFSGSKDFHRSICEKINFSGLLPLPKAKKYLLTWSRQLIFSAGYTPYPHLEQACTFILTSKERRQRQVTGKKSKKSP